MSLASPSGRAYVAVLTVLYVSLYLVIVSLSAQVQILFCYFYVPKNTDNTV